MNRSSVLFAATLLAFASGLAAQSVVAKYDFSDLASSLGPDTGGPTASNEGYFTTSASSDTDPGSTASGLSSGLGGFNASNHYGNSTPGLFFWGTDPVSYGGGGSIQGASWGGATGWQGPGNQSPYYLEFTVTPAAGQALSFTQLKFDAFTSTNNIANNYAVYADEIPGAGGNGFSTQLNSDDFLSEYSWGTEVVDLSGRAFLQNVTTAVTFRIYFWDDNSGWYTCDYVDNIKVLATTATTGGSGGQTPGGCVAEFASTVISVVAGYGQSSANNPNDALGDTQATYYNLGRGGKLVVGFTNDVSTTGDANPDLCVNQWGNADCYYICLQPADAFTLAAIQAAGWHENANNFWEPNGGLTLLCGTDTLDIDALVPGYSEGQLRFAAVMTLDDSTSGTDNGAEIISIEAKAVCPDDAPTCVPGFASEVVGSTLGSNANTSDPLWNSPANALGNDSSDGFSLGSGGKIKLRFDDLYTTSGDAAADICVTEWNSNDCYYVCFDPADTATENALAAAGWTQSGAYWELPIVYCGTTAIDVDALVPGFSLGDLLFDRIMILDDGSSGDGAEVISVEAKFVCNGGPATVKIGDFVFEDLNGNGQQDAGEPGVAGVVVTLLDGAGQPTGQTATTDGAGAYSFDVVPGDYRLQFGAPGDLVFTVQDQGADATDSDVDAGGLTGLVTVVAGADDLTIDAGLVELAKIGNFVFEDLNGNGQQDAGEPGLSGVTVALLDASGQPTGVTTMTDGSGFYQLCVAPGSYGLAFTAPSGYQFTDAGQGGDDELDSDPDPLGVVATFDVTSGQVDDSRDAGLLALATLGDFVFEDLNGNGQQDAGEPGIAGATVTLLDAAGQPTGQTATTGNDGAYSFVVEPGTYFVQFTLPTGFQFTVADQGNDASDSDANPTTGQSPAVTVVSGDAIDTIDAGAIAPAKIGDFVFEDLNGDGTQNPGEPGIGGATVNVLDANGQPTGITTMTASDGSYQVCVEPGTYIIEFILPTGLEFSPADQGNDALDSDANETTGRTAPVTVQSGDVNNDVDAGGIALAKLGNFVFEDLNGNGQQDAGEPGVGGVLVILLDAAGAPAGPTATTANDGSYQICVDPGTWSVQFQLPAGLQFTIANAAPDNIDSDADPMTGATAAVTVGSGDVNFDLDAGVIAIAKIGDFVFEDANGNGQQDAGEAGIGGVTVTLLDAGGQPTGQSTMTLGDGSYLFCVVPGDYIVAFTPPAGLQFTTANQGNDATDSDANAVNGQTGVITIQSGDDIDTVDAGLLALAKIGDVVFEDLNGNGQQNAGEPGVVGVPVMLLDANGSPTGQSTVTGAGGVYQFCVEPGTYIVAFGLPTGFQFTTANVGGEAVDSDANPNNGQTGPITVASGDMNFDVDAGVLALAKIGDFVFEDLNGNGQQDAGEPGVDGVTVVLLGSGGNSLQTTTTTMGGAYLFCVAPGTYSVAFGLPSGFQFTTPDQGSDATDSDAFPGTGATAAITVQSGDMITTLDAGLLTPAKLGDFVFEDLNGNGQQDAGEPGVANVGVSLVDTSTGNTVQTTQTLMDGSYLFCVVPGTYMVVFTAPAGFDFTVANVGSDSTDSDADANGDAPAVTVGSGDVVNTIDAGLTQPSALGDLVFEDLNANGVQDAGEPGVGGVLVFLLDANGVPTGETTITALDGSYGFMVPPGTWSVSFQLPAGYRFTVANIGLDDLDSDADPATGATPPVTVGSGETVPTLDAGIVLLPNPPDYQYPNKVCGFDDNGFPVPGNPSLALGAPNGQAVAIGNGGCIVVCRTCQYLTTSGDGAPDLSVMEFGDLDDFTVGLLPGDLATEMALIAAGFDDADGNGFYEVAAYFGSIAIDLDALIPGFAAGDLLFASVKIADVSGGPNGIAEIDAVGFASVVNYATDVDPSGLADADWVRFVRDFQPGTGVLPASNNPNDVEGPSDGFAVSLGENGKIMTGFLSAWFANSGDAAADVYVFENGEDEGYFVGLCPADAFTTQALISGGFSDPDGDGCYLVFTDPCPGDLALDIDAILPGYDKGELKFVEIQICDDGFGPDTSPESGADIDAIAMTVRVQPGNVPTSDWLFEAGVNGTGKSECPANLMVEPGDLLELEVSSPSGLYDGVGYLIGVMCVPTGTPITPPMALPGVWLNPDRAPVFLIWQNPFEMPQDFCIPIVVPPGVEGLCCTIQAFGLTSTAPNGFIIASNAFEVCAE
ncbi:MAG: SdrD B-like domain-containing protein [Planctomycetota bacterium]